MGGHRAVIYTEIGVCRVKLTGDPVNLTQMVKGSLPTFSVAKPCVLVTGPGTVTGIAAEQVFPFADTVKPVILPLAMVQLMLYPQASRACLSVKAFAKSDCLSVSMGQLTSLWNSWTISSIQNWKSDLTCVPSEVVKVSMPLTRRLS